MTFNELVNKRHSVRKYSDKEVNKEDLLLICKTAALAPSSCNSQPWKMHIITKESKEIDAVRKACQAFNLNGFLKDVYNFIVVEQISNNIVVNMGSKLTKNDLNSIDLGILTSYIDLKAVELGLGTCILGSFRKETINKAMNFSDDRIVRIVIAIGYEQDDVVLKEKVRKKEEKIIEIH